MNAPAVINEVVAVGDPVALFDVEEADLSSGLASNPFSIKGSNKLFVQSIVANYTSWTVDLQISLDGGTTWTTIQASLLTATGPVNTNTYALPAMGDARLLLTGTSSGSTDTALVYACIGTVPA
jgi:hypothetical protein